MAYQSGTSTNMADLLGKLMTFATANGWTQDELDLINGKAALHKNSIYVSFRWLVATPLQLSVHQALGFTASNEPGTHPNDSGNGYNSTSSHSNTLLDNERCVHNLGNGAYPHYAFFEDDDYIHIAVEISTDVFRHFGFGQGIKRGDWVGGEYAYGHFQSSGGPLTNSSSHLMDGGFEDIGTNDRRRAATMHVEGLPNQDGAGKWGQVWGYHDNAANIPDDSANEDKISIQGGHRAGPVARNFGWIPSSQSTGQISMYPFVLYYVDIDNSKVYELASIPDMRGINIRNFAPKQEVVIGSDTWVIYPTSKKSTAITSDYTAYAGVAYKKVTT